MSAVLLCAGDSATKGNIRRTSTNSSFDSDLVDDPAAAAAAATAAGASGAGARASGAQVSLKPGDAGRGV
jgi:hypothetical protein